MAAAREGQEKAFNTARKELFKATECHNMRLRNIKQKAESEWGYDGS
jgi:hypothetical protein